MKHFIKKRSECNITKKSFRISFEVGNTKKDTIKDSRIILAECYEDAIKELEDEINLPFIHIVDVKEI
jgi:hypothetical protein